MCDHLVAWWDCRSRGTLDSITRARKASKLSAIYPREAMIVATLLHEFDATVK